MRRPRLFTAASVTLLLASSGCREPKIETYTAPKDPPPSIAMGSMGASGASLPTPASPAPAIRWQLPEGWTDQGANNIRLGNILVTGPDNQRAEMTVTRFEGDVGGDLANVNRWRNQLQLPPLDNATLAPAISHLDLPAGHMDVVDLVSDTPLANAKNKTRTLVAWLKQPDATWFFKLTGDDPLVSAQRDAFAAFLRSVELSAATATTAGSASGLPAGHPPLTDNATPVSVSPAQPGTSMASSTLPAGALSSSEALTWTAPSGWTEKPRGPVRKGSFAVGDADLSVTAFPGTVGGLLANLNRWRGELQLAPIADADLAANTATLPGSAGLTFTLVDFAGTPGGTATRTLGAILPLGTETYFFKLKGPDATVAAAKGDFLAFLATVKSR